MIDAARPSGQGGYLLGDRGGRHLRIRQGGERGKRSWIFKYTTPAGEKKKLGLGVYPDVGLAQAREAALGMRQFVSAGKGPKDNPNRPADPAGHHRIAGVRCHFHQGIRTEGVRRAKCWLASPFRDERIVNLEPPGVRSTDAPSQYRNERDSLGK